MNRPISLRDDRFALPDKMNRGPIFPNAPQPDIVLAAQKDRSYEEQVVVAVDEAVQQLLSRRTAIRFKREIQFLGELLYSALTSGCGLQTLGEEYCFMHQVTDRGRMPTTFRRGCFVFCKVVVPYVIDHLSKQQILLNLYQSPPEASAAGSSFAAHQHDEDESTNVLLNIAEFITTSWNSIRRFCQRYSERIQKGVDYVMKCQTALFYVFGSYYLISHGVTGIRLFNIDGKHSRVPQYYLLGVFLVLQLLIAPLLDGDRLASASSSPAAVPVPVLDADGETLLSQEPEISGDDNQSVFTSKCPLCLEECKAATSIPCGHVFCWKCIAEWVQDKEDCPLCRKKTQLQYLVPIYHADF